MEYGFTLIEVLIAMVILAVGLLGLGALGVNAVHSVALADRNSRAAATANEYLEDAIQRLHQNDVPVSCEDQELDNGDLLVRQVVISNDPRLPHRVTVIVTPEPRGGVARPYTVTSHVFANTTTGASPLGTC